MEEMAGVAASGSSSINNSVSSSGSSIITNYPLIAALVAFAVAQSTKLFTSW